jgi:phenylacetate-CoA ligase
MVEPEPDSAGPFYRYNVAEKQVYLSAFHLRPDTASCYVTAFRKHDVQWLTGYAVSSYLLARFILETGMERLQLKAVVTTSEGLTREMREVMERAYGCRIYEEYGTVENAVFASECEAGRLHVSPDVGIFEILGPNGSPSAPGEIGEVVATPFLREHHLFVRYRLGDLASWDSDRCPCGRRMPVLKQVVGRIEDVVIGRDGRKLVRFHGIFTDQPNVKEGQVIQQSRDRLILRIVATAGFSDRDRQDLVARTERRLGPGMQVEVQEVSFIPRTKSGKFKAVVSLLEEERGLGCYTDSLGEESANTRAHLEPNGN